MIRTAKLILFSLAFALLLTGCVTSYFSSDDLLRFRTEAEKEFPKSLSYAQLLERLTKKYGNQSGKIFFQFRELEMNSDGVKKNEEYGMTKFRGDLGAVSRVLMEKRGDYNWWIMVQLRVFAYYFLDSEGRMVDIEVMQNAYGP